MAVESIIEAPRHWGDGIVFDNYQLVVLIGEGTYGQVGCFVRSDCPVTFEGVQSH